MKYKTATSVFPSSDTRAEKIAEQVYYAEPYPKDALSTIPKTAPIIAEALAAVLNDVIEKVAKCRNTFHSTTMPDANRGYAAGITNAIAALEAMKAPAAPEDTGVELKPRPFALPVRVIHNTPYYELWSASGRVGKFNEASGKAKHIAEYIAAALNTRGEGAAELAEAKAEIERLKDSNKVLWESVNSLSTQALMIVGDLAESIKVSADPEDVVENQAGSGEMQNNDPRLSPVVIPQDSSLDGIQATCPDCYEIGVIRNSDSPKLVNLCARHAACDWVVCGMDEAFPRQVTLTFATEDAAYAYWLKQREHHG